MTFLLLRVSAALMFAIISFTFLQVVLRYAFNHPISWMEEASRYLFVWIVMIGSALAFRNREHIKIDIIDSYVSKRYIKILLAARIVVCIVAIAILMYSGYLIAWRNRFHSFYTLPDVSLLFFYVSIPLASFIMIIYLLNDLRRTWLEKG